MQYLFLLRTWVIRSFSPLMLIAISDCESKLRMQYYAILVAIVAIVKVGRQVLSFNYIYISNSC